MVTLESGRVKPDDLATIKLVLTAAEKFKDNKYSIIINKMTEDVETTLRNSKEERSRLTASFLSLGVSYDTIFYVPYNPEWNDKKNARGRLSPELYEFINAARSTKISTNMKSIQTKLYSDTVDDMNKAIQREKKLEHKHKNKVHPPPYPLFSIINSKFSSFAWRKASSTE